VTDAQDNSSPAEHTAQAVQPVEPAELAEPVEPVEPSSSYHMPPPFYPTRGVSVSQSNDSVKFPRHPSFGAQQLRTGHPNSNNVVFGGYTESNGSSPAPPLSANNVHQFGPVPQEQYPLFSNGPAPGPSNGYSPTLPPGPPGFYQRRDSYQAVNAGDFGRRQLVSFTSPDGYSPASMLPGDSLRFAPFDPTTPHSFQGSQSSVHNDSGEYAPPFYNQYSGPSMSNGTNGHMEDVRLYQQAQPKGTSQSVISGHGNFPQLPMKPPSLPPSMDNLDGLLGYIMGQFADPTFADYTLELRYTDDRAPPARVTGHNLLFARSPTLSNLMRSQASEANGDNMSVRTLLLETDDRFLRSDAFSLAIQRLYGGPLLDAGALPALFNPHLAQGTTSTMPGTPTDRFELALGYAAAGHILKMPPVINRGVEIASCFVNWATVEKAFDFALDGGLDSHWIGEETSEGRTFSTYGPAVNGLIHHAMNFIISNFPPNFDLDISVGDPLHTSRLPVVPEGRSSQANQRLSSIKFGDHPSEDSVKSTSTNPINSTLSRLLLALPFQLLKHVLESSRLGNVEGWATTKLRQKVMHTVIEERERRRLNVYNSRSISNAERLARRKAWESVGWQEQVLLTEYDVYTLVRKQVNFLLQDE
jgi:hypothetical protein